MASFILIRSSTAEVVASATVETEPLPESGRICCFSSPGSRFFSAATMGSDGEGGRDGDGDMDGDGRRICGCVSSASMVESCDWAALPYPILRPALFFFLVEEICDESDRAGETTPLLSLTLVESMAVDNCDGDANVVVGTSIVLRDDDDDGERGGSREE